MAYACTSSSSAPHQLAPGRATAEPPEEVTVRFERTGNSTFPLQTIGRAKIGLMPSRLHPDLPEEVGRAVAVFGISEARYAVLVCLAQHGGQATTTELLGDLQVSRVHLLDHLRALRRAGAVTSDEVAGSRAATWAMDVTLIERDLIRLGNTIRPERWGKPSR